MLTVLTHHNATAVGTVMALQFGPPLLLLPLTGFAADHFDRRKLLLFTQAASGLLALGLGLFVILNAVQLWHAYGFALALGCVTAFDAPARQAFVSDLVSDDDLANAVALNSASFNGSRMIGPPCRRCFDCCGWGGLAIPYQCRLVRCRPGIAVVSSKARITDRSSDSSHAPKPARRISLRVAASRSGRRARDAFSARHVWLQLRHIYLNDVGHHLPRRCEPIRPADLGNGGGYVKRGIAFSAGASACARSLSSSAISSHLVKPAMAFASAGSAASACQLALPFSPRVTANAASQLPALSACWLRKSPKA